MKELDMEKINVEEIRNELKQIQTFRNRENEPKTSITVTCTALLSLICC